VGWWGGSVRQRHITPGTGYGNEKRSEMGEGEEGFVSGGGAEEYLDGRV
jgi:hypothetical protein